MEQTYDVIIIGAGPAGIFTAMELAERRPETRTLIVDLGRAIASRRCPARETGVCAHCDPCGIVHGWAGAGAFSDGKLSLSDEVGGHVREYLGHDETQALIRYADERYLRFGAPQTVYGLEDDKVDEIASEAKKYGVRLIPCPVRHLGTERAGKVLGAMYDYLIQETHTEFAELTNALEILAENGHVTGVRLRMRDGSETIVCAKHVVAAPGRGGAAWLTEQANRLGLVTQNNEVDIGVRVEAPNAVMDPLTRHLYEAKLIYYGDTYENRVRTFCMNPGGVVSEEHYEAGLAVVNGHSYGDPSLRTGNTNFALLVSTRFTEPFDQPIAYGQHIARLANMLTGGPIMVQRLGDLLKGRRTTKERLAKSSTIPTLGTAVPGDLSFVLPARHLSSIVETLRALDHLAPGLYGKNTLLYGVEVKFYSSKMTVDNRLMTAIDGLYAIGDGAGITRGLMQASVTGVAVGRDIAERLEG